MSVTTRPTVTPARDRVVRSATEQLGVSPARIASRLGANTRLWQGVVRFDPAERWYTRIAADTYQGRPGWEAWLLSWLPGQGTPWHDHGGSAGAFTVLSGELREAVADTRGDHPAGRTDGPGPRTRPGTDLATGRVRAFGRHHLHQVVNVSDEPAVSLHVYSPGLLEMNDYTEVDGRLLLTASRRAEEGW